MQAQPTTHQDAEMIDAHPPMVSVSVQFPRCDATKRTRGKELNKMQKCVNVHTHEAIVSLQ